MAALPVLAAREFNVTSKRCTSSAASLGNQAEVVLLCGPIVGLLDSWLPVIARIRDRDPGVRLTCVFPERRILEQMRENPTLLTLAEGIFDEFALAVSDRLLLRSSCCDRLLDSVSKGRLIRLVCGLEVRSRTLGLRMLGASAWRVATVLSGSKVQIRRIQDLANAESLLFDIRETDKPYCKSLFLAMRDLPAYSVAHGLGSIPASRQDADTPARLSEPMKEFVQTRVCAFLHSPKQAVVYKRRYGLREDQMETAGILRHEASWLASVRKVANDLPDRFAEGFVFLVSRPATGILLPERKRRSLEHLADCIQRLGPQRIVVKRHPKEDDENCFAAVFGEENYGKTWIYSRNHPLDLGMRCTFAFAFCSGIVADMAWLGVPAIEYLDLRGIPEYDNVDSFRDHTGNPILEFRFNELALGVQDHDSLENAIIRIKTNREQVIAELRGAYQRIFPVVEGIQEDIARRIISPRAQG